MAEIKGKPFRRTRAVQNKIDEFLDKVAEGTLTFEHAVLHYIEHGYDDVIQQKYEQLSALEKRGDELRRSLEMTMYTEMLIPEARGDVLELLDDLDHLLDLMKKDVLSLTIEQPPVPEEVHDDFRALIAAVARCIDMVVVAARAYFRDPKSVRDHIAKVGFYESESDAAAIRVRRTIMTLDTPLERKMLLRNGVMEIDGLADAAEDTGDRLAIYAVKRSL